MPYFVCVDVYYHASGATAAALAFADWSDAAATEEVVVPVAAVAPYEPGKFYLRELPCIKAALAVLAKPPEIVIVDGYVWLTSESHPGLGAHLFAELSRTVPVIGVAKTAFHGATCAVEVLRGTSKTPLHITSAGMDVTHAAAHIQSMHGLHRIPTLLKRVDQLSKRKAPALGPGP